jgi:AraC-like DNA-binding protein
MNKAKIDKEIFPGLMMPPFHYACFTYFSGYSEERFYTAHNCFQVLLGLSGVLEFELEEDKRIIKSKMGSIFVLSPGIRHRWRTESDCENFMFFCDGFSDKNSELSRIFNVKQTNLIWDFALKPEIYRFYVKNFRTLINSHAAFNANVMYGLLYAFCGEICREACKLYAVGDQAKLHPAVARAVEMIQGNYRGNITLARLAKYSSMSPSRLSELFNEAYGMPPIQYIHELKIKKARQLLAYSDMNITQIAEYLGFSSVHYFSRFFKNHTGEMPSTCMIR